MKRLFTLFVLMIVSVTFAVAQQKVSGTITDENGEPLIGANVIAKGTTVGTVTDFDGNFELDVPAEADILVFSYTGYESIELPATSSMEVVMSEGITLETAVVTALGVSRDKKRLGYGVSQVSSDEIVNSGEQNIIQALAGKSAGVQVNGSGGVPGASSKVLIRGVKSISLDSDPLIILDGVPINNSTEETKAGDNPFNANLNGVNTSNRGVDINPDDIESVTVLKGPAAAALYGSQGANGAIVYTTKRGKQAGGGKKIGIDVSFKAEFQEVSQLPELQSEYAQGAGGTFVTADPGPDETFFTADDVSLGTSANWGPRIDSDPELNAYDNYDNFFETGTNFITNVSMYGGNETSSFRLSYGYTQNDGVVPNTEFDRHSVRITGDVYLTDHLKVGATANYINTTANKAQNGSNLAGVMLGLTRAPASFDIRDYKYNNGNNRTYFAFYDNPLYTAYENPFTEDVNRIIGNVFVTYDQWRYGTFGLRTGVDAYGEQRQQNYAISSFGDDIGGAGQVNYNTNNFRRFYNDFTISKDFSITDGFDFGYLVGTNWTTDVYNTNFARGTNLSVRDNFNLANAATTYASNLNNSRELAQAVYAQLNFDLANQVFVTVSGRNDWSSNFGPSKNNYFYPSASASWIFTELVNGDAFFGKLRTSYAEAGKTPDPYSFLTPFEQPTITDGFTNGVTTPYGGRNGFGYDQTLGDLDLKPERTKSIEAGIELRYLPARIGIDFNYYNETSEDLLIFLPLGASSGYRFIYTNAGELENKGYEVEFDWAPVASKDFRWDISAVWSKNENEVTKLAPGVDEVNVESAFSSIGSFAIVGEPIGAFFGTAWQRDANGNLVIGSNGLPIVLPETQGVGNPLPDWIGSLRNTLSFKGFRVSALIERREGGDLWNGTKARLNNLGRTAESADRERTYVIPGVQADGTPNTVEIDANTYFRQYLGDAGGAAEQFVEDGSWWRLRDVSLSYKVPVKAGVGIGKTFNRMEVTFTGRNLWLETDYTGVDPETSLTGAGSLVAGLDYFNMPNTKSYNLAVNFGF